MLQRLKALVQSIREAFSRSAGLRAQAADAAREGAGRTWTRLNAARGGLIALPDGWGGRR